MKLCSPKRGREWIAVQNTKCGVWGKLLAELRTEGAEEFRMHARVIRSINATSGCFTTNFAEPLPFGDN